MKPQSAAAGVLLLLASSALLLSSPGAAANDSSDPPLRRLREGGEVSCRPALPYFCENVHVKCLGQTAEATFAFTLRAGSGPRSLALAEVPEEFARRYANAEVEWSEDGDYVLLRPRQASGYLKLLSDGKYVLRHYRGPLGVMSLGACR